MKHYLEIICNIAAVLFLIISIIEEKKGNLQKANNCLLWAILLGA